MKRVLLAAAVLSIAACNGETTAPTATAPALRTDIISTAATVGTVAYNHIPNPLPPNVASVGFQATQTSEFGDYVRLGGAMRRAGNVTVVMSDWAKRSEYSGANASGFLHDITLNIYNVDNTGPVPAVGTRIGTLTRTFTIPWRPESNCPSDATAYLANDGNCYHGLAFTISFDLTTLSSPLTLPNDVIIGIAYNTNTWGYFPLNEPGPYESLNVGTDDGAAATAGTDVDPDAVFWNTATAAWYADGGTGGTRTFRMDTNWTGYAPAFSITTFYPIATTVNGCAKNGWHFLSRVDGTTFKSQKECTNYVSGK